MFTDFNSGDNAGSAYFQVNQRAGRRWSAARAFLKPVLNRPNLRLETGVEVERVVFDRRRATGVVFRKGDERFEAGARGEVILAAGAVGSPKLLQLSGLGAGDDLREDIDVPLTTAVLGGEVEVPTLTNRVMLKIPPLTQNGKIFKLGGLGMRLPGFGFEERERAPTSAELAEAWRPWMEHLIECFGAARCMFESNFPVDKGGYAYGVGWNAMKRLAAGASDGEKADLFWRSAARFYRLPALA